MFPVLIIPAVIVAMFVLVFGLAVSAGLLDRVLHPHGYEASPQEVREQLQEIQPPVIKEFNMAELVGPRPRQSEVRLAGYGFGCSRHSKSRFMISPGPKRICLVPIILKPQVT